MINVYIDPLSFIYLRNNLFGEDEKYKKDNTLSSWFFLKKYCGERGLILKTIDFWDSSKTDESDIYVSIDHKRFARRIYWKMRNKRYPINVDLTKFKKRILFHFEPPIVMPEISYGLKKLTKIYDKIFFTWKTGVPGINYFYFPQFFDGILPEYWNQRKRGFLTIINSNRKPIFRYKELFTERVKAILFFGKTNDIDLYGFNWDKPPLFPYWFQKKAIKKVYKGSVENKHQILSKYNFALAFENCELPGYITEKIFDCFYSGTIPIYLGAPDIENYIPKDCFINKRDFKNYEELKNFLKSLTESEIQRYRENGRRFLESEQYKVFTHNYFIKKFVEACIN